MRSARQTTTIQWESQHSLPVGNAEVASYTHNGISYGLKISRSATTDADWMVSFDSLSKGKVDTTVPWERRLLLVTEPMALVRGFRQYCEGFRDQFGVVVTPHNLPRTRRKQKIVTLFPLLGTHYGIDRSVADTDAEVLTALKHCMTEPDVDSKVSTISVINSGRKDLPGQTYRNSYVAALKRRLGTDLEAFGKTHRPVARKLEAIAPYRYHVVFENNFDENMWTEKLADAFVGLTLPFYVGCPNVERWFDKDAFVRLPQDDPDKAAEIIRETVKNGEFERRLPLLRETRRKVLEAYCPYAQLANVLAELSRDDATRTTRRLEQPVRIRNNRRSKSISDKVATRLFRMGWSLRKRVGATHTVR